MVSDINNSIFKHLNEGEEYKEDEDYEEYDIFEEVSNWDGDLANEPCEDYEWEEIKIMEPDLFKQALEARENYVVSNYEWASIPEQVWEELYELCDEKAIQGTPGTIIDNVIINGDYGDFDDYKEEGESDEDFISRVEDSVWRIFPEDRFVIFSL